MHMSSPQVGPKKKQKKKTDYVKNKWSKNPERNMTGTKGTGFWYRDQCSHLNQM